RVSKIKNISNKMIFMSPNYNPAGVHRATPFEKQLLIINTDFQADYTTDVLSTSYFQNDAEMKARMALVDGFDEIDSKRLKKVLNTNLTPNQFVEYTEKEKAFLKNVPCVLITDEFFMNYY